jgi:hypothetical protein
MGSGASGHRPRRRLALAALLSCTVYALPLVLPHTIVFLGESLLHTVTRREKDLAWAAAEVGVALAMQAGAAAIWYWLLGRLASLRPLVLLLAVPAFFAFAEWCYLLALPARFLIEREVQVERRSWSVACTAPDESLVVVGYKPAVVRGGDAMLVSDRTTRLARVTVPEPPGGAAACVVSPLGLPAPTANDAPLWVGDDGRALMTSIAKPTGAQSWLWIAAPGAPPVPLTEPAARRPGDGPPLISRDGRSVAWLTPLPESGQPPTLSIVVRPLPAPVPTTPSPAHRISPPGEQVIDLSRLGPASFVLRDVDTAAREVLLAMNERTFLTVGFDGVGHGAPLRPDGVSPLHMTFRRVGDGWVAWDGYTEEGYTIAWSLPAGHGAHHVPKGRGITDVGVQPGGRLIAVSVTTSLSIGDVRDAVYVLRAADASEVFRHYLPPYARSLVLFPSDDLFAYTDWDGARAATVVLRIPPEALR